MEGRHKYTYYSTLSPRQLEAIKLKAEGFTDKEIAARLYIATSTVKTMLCIVRDKLLAKNSTEATCICLKRGLI